MSSILAGGAKKTLLKKTRSFFVIYFSFTLYLKSIVLLNYNAIIIFEVKIMDNIKVGALIKSLRKEKNLTQLQLADELSISDKTVSKW